MSNKSGSSPFSSWRITSRTAALSDAITLQLHANALRHAEVLAEAKESNLDVDPTSGGKGKERKGKGKGVKSAFSFYYVLKCDEVV
jgi:hypothetical protein